MFANCLVFGDVIEIQSLVFGQNQMFRHVRSSVLKILKKMAPFFVSKVHKLSVLLMLVMFEVQFWAQMG